VEHEPQPARADELDAIVELVSEQQRRPERNIPYVGHEVEGIRAELDGLEPPWTETVRVLSAGDRVRGAVIVEWDEELGRSWIIGPWVVDDDPGSWLEGARALLDAGLAQLPSSVGKHELSGDLAHELLGSLAAGRGWSGTEPNHALVADAATVASWGTGDDARVRPATQTDLDGIAPLHDAEFPDTYNSAAQLVEGGLDGSRVVLVIDDDDGGLAGYAAGRVSEDGEGYLDFLVVDPARRGGGAGRALVQAITRRLLVVATLDRVSLTVQDHRTPARSLYERLGFRPDGSFVGYRSWEQGSTRG
jgi:ribosomal protein S18 acetylase RimI-like enzyme